MKRNDKNQSDEMDEDKNLEYEDQYENGTLVHDKKSNLFGQVEVEYTETNEPKHFT